VAPVRILGWDDENQWWSASRAGEPSFGGVQSLGDAYLACCSRNAALIVPDDVYAQMVAFGEAPNVRPDWATPGKA
jgi:hypothetical protein